MAANNGLASFIGEVPEYEVRDGQMHVTIGDFELVMPLPVFLVGRAKADTAIRRWFAEQRGTVLRFPVAGH